MYCIECGKQIQDGVKYCNYCGTAQAIPVDSKRIEDISEHLIQTAVVPSRSFGLQISPKAIGLYLLWVSIHFILLLLNGSFKYDSEFWPFNGDLKAYDITEFLIYSILPIGIFYSYFLLNGGKNGKTKNEKYDLGFARDYNFLLWGIILIVFQIVFWVISPDYLYREFNIEDKYSTFILISIITRIIVTVLAISYVKKLNRSAWGWGLFAFFMPPLCLLFLSFLKKLKYKSQAHSYQKLY